MSKKILIKKEVKYRTLLQILEKYEDKEAGVLKFINYTDISYNILLFHDKGVPLMNIQFKRIIKHGISENTNLFEIPMISFIIKTEDLSKRVSVFRTRMAKRLRYIMREQ